MAFYLSFEFLWLQGGFLLEDVSTEMDAAYETPNLSTHADG